MYDGVINVLKPPGMTSHDVIGYLRRVLQMKKIGHSGTLDPDAAGVLVVYLGKATRLIEYAGEERKAYYAELTLGYMTDTADDSGKIIKTSSIKELTREEINDVLKSFTGLQEQVPPMYSAVRYQGKKLYELARKGLEVERKAREINVYELEAVYYGLDYLLLRIVCSKGTYIRTLCEDIAEAFGMCGTVSFLLRSLSGGFLLSEAKSLAEIAKEPEACLLGLDTAVTSLPKFTLTDNQALRLSQGVITSVNGLEENQLYSLYTEQKTFIGIARAENSKLKPEKIINPFY
ncbi:MAG TPA: tRNA pseudouridine(55) synthase TruB [Candidatus Avacidaminococcus intestinavium]|uniref:tRNA pseudouridine synthase B n=1 Tax=Candidatus Avacidaminococcus intestinavium TaxID=2840684 RepID=A0A9D1SL59_9FIRM|nr:tRNA pseudouridine(55) synthase TruB [Candidatus Avacidaminococcus intestinavium]